MSYMVSCTSAHCMAHSAQSDGMREQLCVARTCQSMVLTSTDVLAANRPHVGANAALLQLCIAVRRPAQRTRRHTYCPPRSRKAALARSTPVIPTRTKQYVAIGTVPALDSSADGPQALSAFCLRRARGRFIAQLHGSSNHGSIAQSR